MTFSRLIAFFVASTFVLSAVGSSFAQAPADPRAPKRMAETAAPRSVALLLVIHARGATLQGNTLVLSGVAPSVVLFADRPIRAAGHARTSSIIGAWKNGSDTGFDKVPPNAAVSVLDTAKGELTTVVLVLKTPRLDGDRLTFTVERLAGHLGGANGPASIFIETVDVPLARLTSRSGAWYAASP
jgi:hypothetical protein